MAIQITQDANFYQEIADKALKAIANCGCCRCEDAILYEHYLEMLNDNPPMMPFDRPAEF
jgi:hypothetical protein